MRGTATPRRTILRLRWAGFQGLLSLGLYLFGAMVQASECVDWQSHHRQWIFCDDFEDGQFANRQLRQPGRYQGYRNVENNFVQVNQGGYQNSRAMRSNWQAGLKETGGLQLMFGRNPTSKQHQQPRAEENFRQIFYRFYLKLSANWRGNPGKLSRATVLIDTDWSQAMIAHLWAENDQTPALVLDPASCIDRQHQPQCQGYNDFQNLHWLGAVTGKTPIFNGQYNDRWLCIESQVTLNRPGQKDGLQRVWLNGKLEAQRQGLNWVGDYQTYGINALFIENYWGAQGSPQPQSNYFDNLVVSTQRIGCLDASPDVPQLNDE